MLDNLAKSNNLKNKVYNWLIDVDKELFKNILSINNEKEVLIIFYIITKFHSNGNNYFGFEKKMDIDNISIENYLNLDLIIYETKRKEYDKNISMFRNEIMNNWLMINDFYSAGIILLDYNYFKDRINFIKILDEISNGLIFEKDWFCINKLNSISSWIIFFLEKKIINFFNNFKTNLYFIKINEYKYINDFNNYNFQNIENSKLKLKEYIDLVYYKILKINPIKSWQKYLDSKYLTNCNEDFIFYKFLFELNNSKNLNELITISKEDCKNIIDNTDIKILIKNFYLPKFKDYIGFQNIIIKNSLIKYYHYIFNIKEFEFQDSSNINNNVNYPISSRKFAKSEFSPLISKKYLSNNDIIKISKDYFYKFFNIHLCNILLENDNTNLILDKLKLKAIKLIKKLLEYNFKNKTVIVYGSTFYNIKNKDSDIDLMIVNKNNEKIINQLELLNKIKNLFSTQIYVFSINPIFNTKIPVIKFIVILKDDNENYKFYFDICCPHYNPENNMPIGLRSSVFIKNNTTNSKILKELLLILKIVFKNCNLNYCYKGGINFFSLTVLLLTFEKISNINEKNYLENLLQFFEFLITFQYKIYAIDLNKDLKDNLIDIFVIKSIFNNNLEIYDPTIKTKINIAENCFNFLKIQEKLLQWLKNYNNLLYQINIKLIKDLKVKNVNDIKIYYRKLNNNINFIQEIFN